MRNSSSSADEPPRFAVRLRERAQRDLDAAIVYFEETASEALAMEWYDGIREAAAVLAAMPCRYPAAPERFRLEMRRALYRRAANSAAY